MNNLARIAIALLALLVPGGFVFVVIAWLGRKVLRRLEIVRFSHIPLRSIYGAEIGLVAISPDQAEDLARKAYPFRYWLTTTLPKASSRPVAALRARFRPQPPSEGTESILESPGEPLGTEDPIHPN